MLTILLSLKDIILAYWKPLLIAAICWYGYHENNRAVEAENALHTYQKVIAQQVEDQAKSNEIIETKSTKQVAVINTEHEAEVKTIGDRKQIESEIKNVYENRIANLTTANGLLTKTINSAEPVSSTTETSSDAESGAKCDATITRLQTERESLENACAITTSDFNACAGYVETVTNLFGTQ